MTAPPFRVKAVYDYSSPHDDDLSFPNNQIITVTDEEDADWYYGEYSDSDGNKHQGLFPKNFVERYEPATPPRPSRPTRPKKEAEPIATTHDLAEQLPETDDVAGTEDMSSPPLAPVFRNEDKPSIAYNKEPPAVSQTVKPQAPSSATSGKIAEKPTASVMSKAGAPPIVEKPSGNSFRDRIAAFNKSTAPPVAPMKPGGLGQAAGASFIKKSYVAPPPSRNAYVPIPREIPPHKIYHREEDPEVAEQITNNVEAPNTIISPPQIASNEDNGEEQPKPTSLKERIALLQKQQLEQAARHAETPKKEKPKRPPKKRMDSHHSLGLTGTNADSEDSERVHVEESTSSRLGEAGSEETRPHAQSTTRHRSKSREATPLASPTREYQNDPNDADQSGAGETEDGGEVSTERDDSDEKPKTRRSMPPQPIYQRPTHVESASEQGSHQPIEDDEGEDEDEDEDEEEEIDPEVKRKMEIRERMAKMSGGMGMAGMFGPPGGMSMKTVKKVKTSGSSAREQPPEQAHDSSDLTAAGYQPSMVLPGMQRVRSPDETEKRLEVSKEEESPFASAAQDLAPDEVPDMEDVAEDFVHKSRQSEDRGIPPPVPQGLYIPSRSIVR